MALRFGLCFFLILPILLLSYSAAADDVNDDDQLLDSINRYRASLKVPALIENENADCFADEIADQYKNRVCSTVPGIEELSDYPQLLAYCNINISSIKGVIMPICMPNIETTAVISTFTQSLYSGYLNDSQYTGSGIASEDNWIVVVLTARASNRNFTRANVTDDDEEDLLLNGINRYRASFNLSALIENENAECFADKIADLFDYRACRNTTGAITIPSTQYQLPNFPLFLAQCNLNLSNTGGVILPACVPNLEASLVLSNFTQSQYSRYVNDSQYIGAGIATEDDWIIVVLTTRMTRGIFTGANASDDAEDQLLSGINRYRTSLNLSALTENKNAKCFADEMGDQYKNRACSNTTGANTIPGTEDQFSNYPQLLAHCNLNISSTRGGIIMPACIPNLESNLVLSNFTQSQYTKYLNDSQYTGAGIASEDNWIVVVLTTNTPEGSFAKADTNFAGLVRKIDFHCHLLPLLLAFLILLMS